jgi:hypothetical protein
VDGLLIALIGVSVTAPARPRRLAAGILLEMLQSRGSSALPKTIESAEAEAGGPIAEEMRVLIEEYGLAGELDRPH